MTCELGILFTLWMCYSQPKPIKHFDPWVVEIPGGGYGDSLQYSCLENSMDRGVWRAAAHGVAAAAAAKSLQSCPTLCDSIDGSPPGSPVPGILQPRTLEWVAISFSRGSSRPRDPALPESLYHLSHQGTLLLLLPSHVSRVRLCATP